MRNIRIKPTPAWSKRRLRDNSCPTLHTVEEIWEVPYSGDYHHASMVDKLKKILVPNVNNLKELDSYVTKFSVEEWDTGLTLKVRVIRYINDGVETIID